MVAPQRRDISVELQRARVGTVDIDVEDRRPGVGQVTQELVACRGRVERQRAGHDHQRGVAPRPELVDHRRHQAQHAACALEALQRRPVLVEPVEELGVDGVGPAQALQIVTLGDPAGELACRIAVHIPESRHHGVARGVIDVGREEAPAHDLEALSRRDRLPDRLDAAHHVGHGLQHPLARLTADLDVGLRERDEEQRLVGALHRLGQRLHKGHDGVEGAGGEALDTVEVARIGDQLIDDDQRRAEAEEQLAERLGPRADAGAVGLGDHRVALAAAELVGHLAPERACCAVGVRPRLGGIECRAHQHRRARLGEVDRPHLGSQPFAAGQVVQREPTAAEVVERQHAVGLAAAEGGLELHHGLAALGRQTANAGDEQRQ